MRTGAVLVTGASTGIGEATARHLGERGHRVFAGVRKSSDGERLRAAGNGRVTPVELDVTDQSQIEEVVGAIAAEVESDGLLGVVNNAGIALGGPVEFLELDDWRRQFDVNVFGLLAVTKQVLPLIRKARGRIVLVGSIGGRLASPFLAPYSASKFALEAIADSLRVELHPFGIRVALIEPGAVKTEIWEKGRATADELEQELPPEALERYGSVIEKARRVLAFQERIGIAPLEVA